MKVISCPLAPKAVGPYSHGIETNGILFLSGQIPLDPVTGKIVGKDIEEQTYQVIKNIETLLSHVNLGFNAVIKTTCFLLDMADFMQFNEIYSQYFTSKPARSCLAVKTLPKDVLVEIEVIAEL